MMESSGRFLMRQEVRLAVKRSSSIRKLPANNINQRWQRSVMASLSLPGRMSILAILKASYLMKTERCQVVSLSQLPIPAARTIARMLPLLWMAGSQSPGMPIIPMTILIITMALWPGSLIVKVSLLAMQRWLVAKLMTLSCCPTARSVPMLTWVKGLIALPSVISETLLP